MADYERVLITGVAGAIGGRIFNDLKSEYEVTGLDIQPMEGLRFFRVGITDLDSILPAFVGQDAVIHLAAVTHHLDPWKNVLPNNLVGTYNVFEACRIHGVKRVIFASSNHVMGMYWNDHPYDYIWRGEYDKVDVDAIPLLTHESPIRPNGYYAISKAYGESIGRFYSEQHGISCICLRFGYCRPEGVPFRSWSDFATWHSHRDQVQITRKSLEAPEGVAFDVFYGVSDNTWRVWDIDHAREIIGYKPQDNAENFRKSGEVFNVKPTPNQGWLAH